MEHIIIGYGEWLWDMLPDGKRMGGAPANFSFHASQCGLRSCLVSAVSDDSLGMELLQEADRLGLASITSLSDKPTGTVEVELDAEGIPRYQIRNDVAWDEILWTSNVMELATEAEGICFGTLAQRGQTSRATLNRILEKMSPDALRVFDVNLRQQEYTAELVRNSLQTCNVLKLNEEEALCMAPMLNMEVAEPLDICEKIRCEYSLHMLILTCGVKGSYVWNEDEKSYMPTPRVKVADTVGAGDAFTAAFCAAFMQGKSLQEAHHLAVEVSAYVCTQSGAMPVLPASLKQKF